MDFQRARRNLQLFQESRVELQDCESTNHDGSSLDLGASTQVPDSLGIGSSSSPAPETEDLIFVNTQIQGKLDDIEQNNTLRSRLKQFTYPQDPDTVCSESKGEAGRQESRGRSVATISTHGEVKAGSRAKPRPKAKAVGKSKAIASTDAKKKARKKAKSATQLNIDAHECSKTELLLKQLSGKHNKIKDILRLQQASAGKTTKKKQPVTYDIYNAQEWRHIYKRLMETFPQTEQKEVSEVYRFLYGDASEEDLWTSSHQPPESYKKDSMSTPLASLASLPKESQQVTIMSLSQVMSDDFTGGDDVKDPIRDSDTEEQEEKLERLLDESKKEQLQQELVRRTLRRGQWGDQEELTPGEGVLEEDNVSVVSNSTDESIIVIPVETLEAPEASLTHTKTPALPPPNTDEIIDLTRSFKAVQCLISPLKADDAPLVQVPATRTSTVTAAAPNSATVKGGCINFKILKSQLSSLETSLAALFRTHVPALQDQNSVVPPTDTEDNDFENHCLVQLEPIEFRTESSSNDNQDSQLASQSAIKLRQSLKEIGLKPSRSKSQMIASLQAASQNVDSKNDTNIQRKEIHDLLSSLVQSSPSLHEKVYTFQPILLEDLLRQLIVANPFVDYVDEAMIREWADLQGICLKNS